MPPRDVSQGRGRGSPAPPAGPAPGAPAAGFETAYRELQRVIDQLDAGGLGLEDAVRLFERGSQLARVCERLVDEAELRVRRLEPDPAAPFTDLPADG